MELKFFKLKFQKTVHSIDIGKYNMGKMKIVFVYILLLPCLFVKKTNAMDKLFENFEKPSVKQLTKTISEHGIEVIYDGLAIAAKKNLDIQAEFLFRYGRKVYDVNLKRELGDEKYKNNGYAWPFQMRGAMEMAIQHASYTTAKKLFELCCKFGYTTTIKASLDCAARRGRLSIMKFFLSDETNYKKEDLNSFLCTAHAYKQKETVSLLIEKGADKSYLKKLEHETEEFRKGVCSVQ